MDLKLKVELVPEPLWEKNLRTLLKESEWTLVRQYALVMANDTCQVCSARRGNEGVTKLLCHEQWTYDDKKNIQKLTGVQITCFMCNLVNHRGLAGVLLLEGRLDITEKDIEKHFCKVNNCGPRAYHKILEEAFSLWSSRSGHKWAQDLIWYYKTFPSLKALIDKTLKEKPPNLSNFTEDTIVKNTKKPKVEEREETAAEDFARGLNHKKPDKATKKFLKDHNIVFK